MTHLTLSLLAGMFGLLAGSFANVCILRVPAGESVVLPASRCPQCGHKLRCFELIPLFSFLLLRGRCARCEKPISRQYPLVEASSALLWFLCFLSADTESLFAIKTMLWAVSGSLLATALLILAVIDARTGEIPPGLNIFIALLGLGRIAWDAPNRLLCLIGAAAVAAPLLLLYVLTKGRAMGGGDIKLMAAAGLLLGWRCILLAFLLGAVLGSLIHLIRMRFFGAGRSLAFGPYLAAGILAAYLRGETLITLYWQFLQA